VSRPRKFNILRPTSLYMENRYDNELRMGNQSILNLTPANRTLRIVLALEIKNAIKNDSKVLDIGCGEGDSAAAILEYNPGIEIDALDVSEQMIEIAKKNIPSGANFICQDALEYLKSTDKKYDIITTTWTIHNFKSEERFELLKEIYSNLGPGGKLMIMDKIYPDDKSEAKFLLDSTDKRYRYLDEKTGAAMIEHEHQDFQDEFRMDESETIKQLKQIGFSKIEIADRVERELVLIAEK